MSRTGLLAALLVLLAVGACSSEDDASSATTLIDDETSLEIASSPAPTRPPIDLGDRDPLDVFIGEGLEFGEPGPDAAQSADGFVGDPLVRSIVAREAFAAESADVLASVFALALVDDVFVDESSVDGYVKGLASIGGSATQLGLGYLDGFAGSSSSVAVVTFRLDNVVVLVQSDSPSTAGSVASRLVAAYADGLSGTAGTSTPFRQIDKNSVFVDLEGFGFDPFVSENLASGFESLEAPVVEGLADFPEGRILIVGNEIRGAVWAVPVSGERYPSAELLVGPMRDLVGSRAGGEVDERVVAGRTIFGTDGETEDGDPMSVRAFREENLIVVIDALDDVDADALVSEWVRALEDR